MNTVVIQRMSDHIATILREEIIRGQVDESVPLTQQALSDRFCISRMPVRDALCQLENEGYLTRGSNRRIGYAQYTTQDYLAELQVLQELSLLFISFWQGREEDLLSKLTQTAGTSVLKRELEAWKTIADITAPRIAQCMYHPLLQGAFSASVACLQSRNDLAVLHILRALPSPWTVETARGSLEPYFGALSKALQLERSANHE